MARLLTAALLALLALAVTAKAECDEIQFCLQESKTDCALTTYFCAGGLYCRQRDTDPINSLTGEPTGTCVRAPRVGEACSNKPGEESICYDENQYRITCDDPTSSGNGTCKYYQVYAPGEACTDTDDYINGGCAFSACVSGFCATLKEGETCYQLIGPFDIQQSCAPGLFCDLNYDRDGNPPTLTCQKRVGKNENCSQPLQCQANLLCSPGGKQVFDPETGHYHLPISLCREMFAQPEGGGCYTTLECQAGLYCNDEGSCVKPSPLHGDVCTEATYYTEDCQPGWTCECITEISDDRYYELGGRCTYSNEATESFVEAYSKLSTCLTNTPNCQDLNWIMNTRQNSLVGYGPNSCVARCAAQVGIDLDFTNAPPLSDLGRRTYVYYPNVLTGKPLGKCFASSSTALFTSIAVVLAAIVALLD